jgi:integrase
MHLTKKAIDSFTFQGKDASQRDIRWDDSMSGLGVRIYPTGKKTFVLSYRHQGRKRLMAIGHYGVLTLDQARDDARAHLVTLTHGTDPLAEAQRVAQGATIKELSDLYIERHAKPHKKTWKDDASIIKRLVLPRWASMKITATHRTDVSEAHRRIGANHPYAANRFVELVSKMYELAKLWGMVDADYANPARGIKAFTETKRDRFVTAEELPKLAQAIAEEINPYIRAAFWLYLLTGMRKRELLQAKWADIDMANKVWCLPVTKSKRSHYIPISQKAIALLSNLPREEGNPYVIVGAHTGKPMNNIDKAWRRVRARAGLDDVRVHDLRRTAGSHLAQDGAPLHLIGKILNHRDPSTTAIYAHFQQTHERAALDRHADRLFAAAFSSEDQKVVAIRNTHR